jgi:hypothetical protein
MPSTDKIIIDCLDLVDKLVIILSILLLEAVESTPVNKIYSIYRYFIHDFVYKNIVIINEF